MTIPPGAAKLAVFALGLVPLALLLAQIIRSDFGPDPAQELAGSTGEWSLRLLLATLCLTPLRQLTGKVFFVRIRRMVGLFALFYASLHAFVWLSLLLGFRWHAIGEELLERPYVTVGFASLLILVALGITSPKAMVRRMGRNWKRLHRLVYVAAILAIVHLAWVSRTDFGENVFHGSILALLLGYRLWRRFARTAGQAARR